MEHRVPLAAVRDRVRGDSSEAAVALRVVCAGMAAYAALFAFASVVHFLAFQDLRFDLGNMVQAISNTLHGHFLETTTYNGEQRDRLGFHVDPLLLVLAPLFWIWSSPMLLLVVQSLAVASGALPVFWLARKHLESPRAGAYFAFAYLLYPPTQWNAYTAYEGFHSISLAVPLVLYAVWFLDEDRLLAFSATALLAFTTKEEIPLAVGCLGIWYAVRKGHRVFGLSVFAAGLAVTLFNFLWLIPHFSPTGRDPYTGRYATVGGGPSGVAHKLLSDPMAFVHTVATGQKAFYLALLLVPFLGLSLLEPLLLLGAVPDLAINLLSNRPHQTLITVHYTAGIVPFVVAAAVFGAARLRAHIDRLSVLVLVGVGCLSLMSPIARLGADVRALRSSVVAAEAHAVGLVPAGVPVSASNGMGSHLSQRRYVYLFPAAVKRARWIVVNKSDAGASSTLLIRGLRRYESRKAWRLVYSSQGIVVLHRR